MLHLNLIQCGSVILDATSCVEIDINELTGVMRGLIDLLIGIALAAPASQMVRRVPILA